MATSSTAVLRHELLLSDRVGSNSLTSPDQSYHSHSSRLKYVESGARYGSWEIKRGRGGARLSDYFAAYIYMIIIII